MGVDVPDPTVKAAASAPRRTVGGFVRSTIAVVTVAVGVLCLTVSPAAIWCRNLVLNTDRYVETLEPLASDPAVQAVVIERVATTLSDALAVSHRVEQVAPRLGEWVGPPLQSVVDTFIRTKTTEFVESPRFVELWVGLNRSVHSRVEYLLTGTRPPTPHALTVHGTTVVLDLSSIVRAVEQRLGAVGTAIAAHVPEVGPTFEIADLRGLDKAQSLTRMLDTLANALPLVGLGLVAIGSAVSRRRRRTVAIASFGVAAGMFVLLGALLIGRHLYLDGIPVSVMPRATATVIFDTVVRFGKLGVRLVFVAALLVGLTAWLAGPGEVAARIRHAVLWVPRALGSSVDSTRVGPFVVRFAAALRWLVAAAMVVLVMFTDDPTGATLLTFAAIAFALLVIIEVLRAMARPVET